MNGPVSLRRDILGDWTRTYIMDMCHENVSGIHLRNVSPINLGYKISPEGVRFFNNIAITIAIEQSYQSASS